MTTTTAAASNRQPGCNGRLLRILLCVSLLVNATLLSTIMFLNGVGWFRHNRNTTAVVITKDDTTTDDDAVPLLRAGEEGNPFWTHRINANKVYGLLHMAKTGGTEINGELANHFERVCGNKGYSYDALETNRRFQQKKAEYESNNSSQHGLLYEMDMGDIISQIKPRHNRGNIPRPVMVEIGFDNCDYVALETVRTSEWADYVASQWPLELHVPCRDALEHLMSSCNHQHQTFSCDAQNLVAEIRQCVKPRLTNTRFQPSLADHENITLYCFDPFPVSRYVRYMADRLQRKRVESKYVHRASNPPRNRSAECLWQQSAEFQEAVRQQLREIYPYYQFCHQCMGSNQELPLAS